MEMGASSVPPVLLTTPTFNGTLAAVRCLGQRGIPVTIAGDTPFAPARWSRYATRSVSCPSPFEPERFMDWLVAFGKREPGHVLYPSCDDLAWLFAHHANELSPYFRLYQPPAATVLELLDKKSLSLRCAEVGVPNPRTLFPGNVEEARVLAEQVGFPLIMKPRTQILLRTRKKGHIVEDRNEFSERYSEFVADNMPHRLARAVMPDVEHPMLQALVPDAAGATYSLSGFISRDRRHTVVRAAMKVLQRPRRVGVGVCFEDVQVDETALSGVMRLCEAVGYFGVFEAEFLPNQGTLELVDFNPRFYGQMGFEAARELDLPYLVWLGAVGESGKLAEAMSHASQWESGRGYVYCDRFYLATLLFLQGLSGRMSTAERTRWREWLDAPTQHSRAFDAIDSPGDPWPAVVSKLREIGTAARHPRAFFRKVIVGAGALAEFSRELPALL
jgi:D-aspartate ligase